MKEIFDVLEDLGAEVEYALERFLDDEELYLKYIKSFPEEKSMQRLEKAVEERDYKAAEESVHALKGIVNNLGFIPVADAAIDMLEELRDDNKEEALEAFNDVREQYGIFSDAIKKWKSRQ